MTEVKIPSVYRVDLRSVTRGEDVLTRVFLKPPYDARIRWIEAGEVSLSRRGSREIPVWTLTSYLKGGITDPEHDSAYALGLNLVGLEYDHTYHSTSVFRAFIDPTEPNGFRVPPDGFDPEKLKGVVRCKSCKEKHLIVPEGWYYPPADEKLWTSLRGMMVEVEVGPASRLRA